MFTKRLFSSSLLNAIVHILQRCAQPQMHRITAGGIIARVTNGHGWWNHAIGQFIRNAMSPFLFCAYLKYPISPISSSSFIWPAFIWAFFIHFCPKETRIGTTGTARRVVARGRTKVDLLGCIKRELAKSTILLHGAPPGCVLGVGSTRQLCQETEASSWFMRPTLAALCFILTIGLSSNTFGQAIPHTLLWIDNSSGISQEDRFEIERRAETGSFFSLASTGPDVTTYQDAQLIVGTLYTYRVRACNVAGCSDYSNEASKIAQIGQAPTAPGPSILTWISSPAIIAQVNFQPTLSPVPVGHQKDDGSVYSAARGYGWDQNLTGFTRDREANTDQRLDTFVYVGAGTTATWNHNLPNGSYLISLAAGDASYAQGPHRVEVEGVVVINNVATAVNHYVTITDILVNVIDGQLSVNIGGAGAGNTMLNHLEVKQ